MEERRVIKFSLVGAIFVLMLIIAIIAGVIVLVVNLNKGDNSDERNKVSQAEQKQLEEEKAKEEEIKNWTISIAGEERKVTPETYKSALEYEMMYDIESFYVQNNKDLQIDEYKSLYTDKIYVNVRMVEGKELDELIKEIEEKKGFTINKQVIDLNGKTCNKVEAIKEDKTEYIVNYYIAKGSGYYVIETHCGSELTDSMIPLMEKMVGTFKF